jgi:DNA-directed RNA polymerase subunit beta
MQFQINKTIYKSKKEIKKKIRQISNRKETKKKYIANIIKKNILKESMKSLFTLNPLSQLLDETNSLSSISHKRKITCIGEGGINSKRSNIKIREIHPSQYGKICPVETTEGKNAGLILSLAKESKINSKGFIETPFLMCKKKKKGN